MNQYIKQVLNKRKISEDSLKFEKQKKLNWNELKNLAKEMAFDIIYNKKYEKICILYDPDVDGLYSGYIMEDYLKRIGVPETSIYRFMNSNKVHGFSDELVTFCYENAIDLLFVVDAGSSDTLNFHIALPNTRVIILDHHEYEEHELPDNTKVSKLNVHDYPDLPALSGCGMTYRFIEAMNTYFEIYIEMYEIFVGITVLSDSCSMTEPENRYYVRKAYENNDYNEFLKTFKSVGFYGSNLSLFSFKIIPYLNALIRIGDSETAMKIVNNMEQRSLKDFIASNEKEIKEKQEKEIEKIKNMSQLVDGDGFAILLRKPNNELKTLNGLVANKIMSKLKKSTFVLQLSKNDFGENIWRGSFRGFDYPNSVLEKYGFECHGHDKACGVSISPQNLREFVNKFEYIPESDDIHDLELSIDEIMKPENAKAIAEFNEYASGNLKPIVIKVTDDFNRNTAYKQAKGFSGKFFIINFKGYDITDFTPDSIEAIDNLNVTVNLSSYNPYQLVRVV